MKITNGEYGVIKSVSGDMCQIKLLNKNKPVKVKYCGSSSNIEKAIGKLSTLLLYKGHIEKLQFCDEPIQTSVLYLFSKGKLSFGQSAFLLEVSKPELSTILAKAKIPLAQYSPEEVGL